MGSSAAILLVKIFFNLQFLSSNAVRLVPVKFNAVNCTIFKADKSNTLPLAPASRAKRPAQSCYLAYPVTDRNGLDLGDRADDFKVLAHQYKSNRTPALPALRDGSVRFLSHA